MAANINPPVSAILTLGMNDILVIAISSHEVELLRTTVATDIRETMATKTRSYPQVNPIEQQLREPRTEIRLGN
jgi:hypothetical protein